MTPERVRALLDDVARGILTPEEAYQRLAWAPVEDLGFAQIDHHRALRQGVPEVVYGAGKTCEQLRTICERLAHRGNGFLVTRADDAARKALPEAFPDAEVNDLARTVYLGPESPTSARTRGPVLVVTAGTGDLAVAEEAAVTAWALGNPVERLTDVGVAGLHRVLSAADVLRRAAVVIVVAGMEGALASVVGGLVAAPVIAVPTSVGYGASFAGLAALLAMLNSCAAGVTVVNIDNGFGAACAATRINRLCELSPDAAPASARAGA
ncbi:MAG: nickel pincer cofactor biosynthesis protein LarB [Gemmatimonadetes bacterium]|nr:nickel pincer cofactor biosynthesis protein LarB [Gemmatimonadota bacterium]